MINFRFHLISLVAVFLALGLGVAMGASFVDRATVETLQDRVDALGDGYRRRGDELDATTEQLRSSDVQASALAGEGSAALATELADQPVVLVTTDGVPGEVLDATRTSLAAAGAVTSGTLRLQPALELTDADVVRSARERFGLRGRSPSDLRDRLVADLGASMALLAAPTATGATGANPDGTTPTATAPDGSPRPTSSTTTTAPGSPEESVLARPTDVASARAVLDALVQLGLIAVDTGGAPAGATFPDVADVQYVMALGDASDPTTAAVAVPLATAVARSAPAVLTVAETRPPRPSGQATTTSVDEPERGTALAELRDGPVSDRLSTVDDLEESFGRIALVYAIAEHADGLVGHYGTGAAAQAPFPTVPPG